MCRGQGLNTRQLVMSPSHLLFSLARVTHRLYLAGNSWLYLDSDVIDDDVCALFCQIESHLPVYLATNDLTYAKIQTNNLTD